MTPVEFARRARRLYGNREAVLDGSLRFTHEEFFDRCDRWSSVLQGMGVGRGDRVAYIAPNTHAHLESFYSVPQIGAVVVPINYRLIAEDFAYILYHRSARVSSFGGRSASGGRDNRTCRGRVGLGDYAGVRRDGNLAFHLDLRAEVRAR